MPSILIMGIILMLGFIFGEIAKKAGLPKITGYIIAGILLNPEITSIIPSDYVGHTRILTDISLAFITFSVGGTLLYRNIKTLGRSIINITIFEAQSALIIVFLGFLLLSPLILKDDNADFFTLYLPFSLLVAALASPTDPAASLAIIHEYKCEGEVSRTILGVSAMDDVLGIINYSFCIVLANAFVLHQRFSIEKSVLIPVMQILITIAMGILFGFLINFITLIIKNETEGTLIVVIFSALMLCYGVTTLIDVDQLLATLTMGIIVVNFNIYREKIFRMTERYTETMILVVFFTISGMQLDFSYLGQSMGLIFLFLLLRTVGKFTGTIIGAKISKSSRNVSRYTIGGLIPSGGIIIGLALLIKDDPDFSGFSQIILSFILGAVVVHELIGPITAKLALKKSGEIKKPY